MSEIKIAVARDTFDYLRQHLARPEQVVFGYARYHEGRFDVVDIDAIAGRDIESQSKVHVALADGIRPRLIQSAWKRDLCLIEAHSHGPEGRAKFSMSDLLGFEEWVPHVRWRLQGRPYAALVCAGETWDAIAWRHPPTSPEPVAAIEIVDDGSIALSIAPTQATIAALESRTAWPEASR
jgi:hypothetical protein